MDFKTDVRYVNMTEPSCAADLSIGSERGDYVSQSYVFKKIGRPSRAINLMYGYYPKNKKWPSRGKPKHGRYMLHDGYFSYEGGINGDSSKYKEPFASIRDVRAYGQDVILTLLIDCSLPDEELIQIAKDLRPFGRLYLRINHECNGSWFQFNKEYSLKEVSDFFVRFHNIAHEYAPNIKTIACINGPGEVTEGKTRGYCLTEDKLAPMFQIADLVSVDQYYSLHYGWPDPKFNPANPTNYFSLSLERWWEIVCEFHEIMVKLRGDKETPIYINETNSDAEIDGMEGQAKWIEDAYGLIKKEKAKWFKGITYYHFQDRGGLGLETQDAYDFHKVTENPSLHAYRRVINDPYFLPKFKISSEKTLEFPIIFDWVSSTEAKGIAIKVKAPKKINSCTLSFSDKLNLVLNIENKWFRKSPSKSSLDISSAVRGLEEFSIMIFSPPAGENTFDSKKQEYLNSYKVILNNLPEIVLK